MHNETHSPDEQVASDDYFCMNFEDFFAQDLTNDPSIRNFILIVYCILIWIALVANGCIILAIWTKPEVRNPRNCFICSQAISDLLLVLICVPVRVYRTVTKQWIFGESICKLVAFLNCYVVLLSASSLTAVALDRYFVLVRDRAAKTFRQTLCAIATGWLLCAVASSPLLIYQTTAQTLHSPNPGEADLMLCSEICMENWPDRTSVTIYGLFVLAVQFIVPGLIIASCYVSVVCMLADRMRRRSSDNARRQAWRTTKILASTASIFVICWLPNNVVNILRDTQAMPDKLKDQELLVSMITMGIALTSSAFGASVHLYYNELLRPWVRSSPTILAQLTPCPSMRTPSPYSTTSTVYTQGSMNEPTSAFFRYPPNLRLTLSNYAAYGAAANHIYDVAAV